MSKKGIEMAEWGLIVALVSLLIIGTLKLTVTPNIKGNFETINGALDNVENIESAQKINEKQN